MPELSNDYAKNRELLDGALNIGASFDLSARRIRSGGREVSIYYTDGLLKDDSAAKIVGDLMNVKAEDMLTVSTAEQFSENFLPYIETQTSCDIMMLCKAVFSGAAVIIAEGCAGAVIADARTYPARSMSEPENNRVLRGPHEGFVETLIFNTAMLRRRIRDADLRIKLFTIGERSKTDVALCYMENSVNPKILRAVIKKLQSVKISALTMGQESLLECLLPKGLLNPFPRVRFTERPDAAAASVAEGSIVIITDCTPAAMILPTNFFSFMQDTNDYYFSPFTGSFVRIIRFIIFSMTLTMIPIWFYLMKSPGIIPESLDFIKISEPNSVPLILQLLMVELAVDALKLASINTPSSLGNSLSVISALILGDFAVQSGWLVPEVVLYMSFVAVATFSQSSFEMGWAFKISRLFVILMTELFALPGLLIGFFLVFLRLLTTKTITGRDYLYPLIPFDSKALGSLVFRKPVKGSKN